jgi:uncharacterized membrane protein YjjP (DUF1212 family)
VLVSPAGRFGIAARRAAAKHRASDVRPGITSAELLFLQRTAGLLLEYNVRSAMIARQIDRLAAQFDLHVQTLVEYRNVTLFLAAGCLHVSVPELRVNVAASAEILRVIDAVCVGRISLVEAARRFDRVAEAPPQHRRRRLGVLLGLAGSALAWLLQADWGAMAVSGVSTGLGLLLRQELARRGAGPFVPPFSAAFLGAALGAAAVTLGWTATPALCLVVPALVLVPGPHLLNGVTDMLDNHIQMGLARLGFASGVLAAGAAGVALGAWLLPGSTIVAATQTAAMRVGLPLDVALAGMAACGFGAVYNAPWRVLWISVICGMTGHGIRFAGLAQGASQAIATLCACLAIGIIAGVAADRRRLPFAAVAFAAAVPMMPGTAIYDAVAGGIRLTHHSPDPALAASTLAALFTASFVIVAMTAGLLTGRWLVRSSSVLDQ